MSSHFGSRPRWALRVLSAFVLPALLACGGGTKSKGTQYQIEATIQGLAGKGLILKVNGGQDIVVEGDGLMSLAWLATGNAYTVTVAAQPSNPAQTCTVSNASGEIAQSDVTDVIVACSDQTFSVSVKVSGLAETGTGLALLDTNNDTTANAGIPISRDGIYAITPVLADNAPYWITIASGKQPTNPWQTCSVENGKGATHGANVTVNVTCVTNKYNVEGEVTGLVGTGLKLSNGGTDLSIDSASSVTGSIRFSFSGIDSGSSYAITITPGNQPVSPPQLCKIVNGTGTVLGTDVTGVQVTCQTLHSISGKISGPAPFNTTGIKVSLAGDKVASASLDSEGTYTFDGLADGQYTVGVPFVAGWSPSPARISVTMQQAHKGDQNIRYVPAWEWSSPLPGGNSQQGVWGSSKDDVWTVGNYGTIRRWNGTTWTTWTTGTTSNLMAVWGSAPDNAWAVGEAGTILHWDGTSWNPQSSGTTANLNAVWGSASNDVWAAGSSGTILRWNGTSWAKMTSGNTNSLTSAIRGIWGVDSKDVWVAGDALLAHWNGSAWTSNSVGSTTVLRSVFGTKTSDVWAVGVSTDSGGKSHSVILRWNGTSWAPTNTGVESLDSDLYGVWTGSSNDVWAVGGGARLLHWGGSSWSVETSPALIHYWAVWGIAGSDVWAVGQSGGAVRRSGTSWTLVGGGSWNSLLLGIWGSSATDIWSVGTWGNMEHRAVQGQEVLWTLQPPSQSLGQKTLLGIWGSASNNIWAVGDTGTILFYDGTSWTGETAGANALSSVWGSAATNQAWAVGDAGTVLHLKNGTWSADTQAVTYLPLWRVWGSSAIDVWAVASGGIILHSSGNGAWADSGSKTTETLLGLWGHAAQDVWAVGSNGTIVHWNGSWSAPFNSGTTQFLKSVWGTDWNDVWAVGEGGTILHWDGSNWSATPSGTNEELRDVWGSGSHDVWAVGYCGNILHWRH